MIIPSPTECMEDLLYSLMIVADHVDATTAYTSTITELTGLSGYDASTIFIPKSITSLSILLYLSERT